MRPSIDDGRARVDRLEHVLRDATRPALGLIARCVEVLLEVALSVEQRDADDRHAQIGGGAQRVAGENTETAAVCGDRLVEGDLHREVGDRAIGWSRTHQVSPNAGVGERCYVAGARKLAT